jgi:DnaJ-class molecular chaperone
MLPGNFVVPRHTRICASCGGATKVVKSRKWPFGGGPYFADCEECEATGMLVDWEKVEEEFEEMIENG